MCPLAPKGLTGFDHRCPSWRLHCVLELSILAAPSSSPIKFNGQIRFNGSSFENGAFPSMISACRQCEAKAIAHLDRCGREQPASSLFSNDGCELVLSREGDNHLRRAGGMAIDEQNDLSMERLRAQSFGFEHDGFLCQHRTSET